MKKMRKLKVVVYCWTLIVGLLFCGCGVAEKSVELTEEQEAKVEIICQNIDKWGESYYDSGQYWPMNHIYISETEDGTTLMTVGYLGEPKGSGMVSRIYLGVRCYVIDEEVKFGAGGYQSLELVANGVEIDLENMSDDDIREAIEQSYLRYVNNE